MDHVDQLKIIVEYVKGQPELMPSYVENNFQLLISTVLSSRTKDETTIQASMKLFSKYPDPCSLSKARVHDIERLIKPVGFYRIKARRVKEIAKYVCRHGIPETLEDLMKLPGVGRKTANLVLSEGFGKPTICVDTHVHRISNRIGWVRTKNPLQTEQELMKLFPKKYWRIINESLVKFGKSVCKPIKPLCDKCPLIKGCLYGLERMETRC